MISDSQEEFMKNTKTLVMCALLTAIVVVLQYLGSFIRFGPFSISLVLVPIVIGAAVCGKGAGAWLGFVFGAVVLFTDSAAFMAVNAFGTIVTVLVKGIAAGLCAGLVYGIISKKSIYGAAFVSALICPIVNTGIFLIGCRLFFMDALNSWGAAAGFESIGEYIITVLVGINFVAELLVNLLLSPIIVRLLKIKNI